MGCEGGEGRRAGDVSEESFQGKTNIIPPSRAGAVERVKGWKWGAGGGEGRPEWVVGNLEREEETGCGAADTPGLRDPDNKVITKNMLEEMMPKFVTCFL